ncbi:MAG: RNA polymerase sigma factor [Elioraea tepidiphila]
MTNGARAAVEQVARTSYGRLVAWLAAATRDVAAAEDALADVLAAALAAWTQGGVPDRPEAWLLTAARRRLADAARRKRVRLAAGRTLEVLAGDGLAADDAAIPDRRLELMIACTHPAIAEAIRAPLMLQVVLGIDAARIASAFCVTPAAMGQALSRAKTRLRDAGVPFGVPDRAEWPARLGAVLDAVYACYGLAWDDLPHGGGPGDLAREGVWLARVIAGLLPDEPEALGLLALVLFCEARRDARRGADGRYVPLDAQDTGRWVRNLLAEAETVLARAARAGRPGRYQLEAAIQSAHVARRFGAADWTAIARLYDGLVTLAPSLGALVGRAAALAEADGPEAGLAALDAIPRDMAEPYQPWWALRADLLMRLGRCAKASPCFGRAIALATDPAVRAFLAERARAMRAARRRPARRSAGSAVAAGGRRS